MARSAAREGRRDHVRFAGWFCGSWCSAPSALGVTAMLRSDMRGYSLVFAALVWGAIGVVFATALRAGELRPRGRRVAAMTRQALTRQPPRRSSPNRPLSLVEFAALLVVVSALMLALGHIMPGGS